MPSEEVRLEPCDLPSAEERDLQRFAVRRDKVCWLCQRPVATRQDKCGQFLCRTCSGLRMTSPENITSMTHPENGLVLMVVRDFLEVTRRIVREEIQRNNSGAPS